MKREIDKEIYDRAMANNGFIVSADKGNVFTISELCGYGVYRPMVKEENGKYYVYYTLGDSCD